METTSDQARRIDVEHLDLLFSALHSEGFQIVGPTLRSDAIVYDELQSPSDLPQGWTDDQEPGKYRIKKSNSSAYFSFNNGPQSWKKYLFAPKERLWRGHKDKEGSFNILSEEKDIPKLALIGARSCDLHAIEIQDRVFLKGRHQDQYYQARRKNIFIVAVNCSQAGKTCFCVSMGTGPQATFGFDISLTEIQETAEHYFVAVPGTDAGVRILDQVSVIHASQDDRDAATRILEKTARSMGRTLETHQIKELLYENQEHPRWDQVADRCLSCTNCTLVCPTCFCSNVEDHVDLAGTQTERWRRWDSCFTLDHSYIHGGSVHGSTKSRYRQWLTHKVASWIDQYDVSGCVGCGRCITWCPVGIDITEEVAAIRSGWTPKGTLESAPKSAPESAPKSAMEEA